MVRGSAKALHRVFRALASAPRREILRLAARERCAVTQFAAQLKMSEPAVSKTRTRARPPLMDRQKEVSLALSACPAALADKAAVYVLERSGYVKVRSAWMRRAHVRGSHGS